MGVEDVDDLGEIRERPRQAIDLVDNDDLRLAVTLFGMPFFLPPVFVPFVSPLAACEAELVASAEAEAEAGFPGQKESELAVVRVLLRLILSPNVRMPLSRLQ